MFPFKGNAKLQCKLFVSIGISTNSKQWCPTVQLLEDCSVKSKCTFKYAKKKKKSGSSSMNVVQRYPSSGSILGTHLIINIYWGPAPCQAMCYLLGVRID